MASAIWSTTTSLTFSIVSHAAWLHASAGTPTVPPKAAACASVFGSIPPLNRPPVGIPAATKGPWSESPSRSTGYDARPASAKNDANTSVCASEPAAAPASAYTNRTKFGEPSMSKLR